MTKGEGKDIYLPDARLFCTVNNTFPGNTPLFFPIKPILPFFRGQLPPPLGDLWAPIA